MEKDDIKDSPFETISLSNSFIFNPRLVWKWMHKINNLLIFICIRRILDSI